MYPMILVSRDAIFHGTKLRSRLHVFRKLRIVCTYMYILQFILSSVCGRFIRFRASFPLSHARAELGDRDLDSMWNEYYVVCGEGSRLQGAPFEGEVWIKVYIPCNRLQLPIPNPRADNNRNTDSVSRARRPRTIAKQSLWLDRLNRCVDFLFVSVRRVVLIEPLVSRLAFVRTSGYRENTKKKSPSSSSFGYSASPSGCVGGPFSHR